MDELQTLRLENARLQAMRDYPGADPGLLDELTDLAQIARVAERDHQRTVEFQQQQRQGTGATPTPPANSDAATTEAEAQYRRTAAMLKHPTLRQKVDIVDAELFMEQAYKRSWNAHMAARKAGGLKTQDMPDTGLPPVRRGGL